MLLGASNIFFKQVFFKKKELNFRSFAVLFYFQKEILSVFFLRRAFISEYC